MVGAALAPVLVGSFFEMGKLFLQLYLQYMKVAGKTPEEIEETYQEEKAKFLANDPSTLPPVPH